MSLLRRMSRDGDSLIFQTALAMSASPNRAAGSLSLGLQPVRGQACPALALAFGGKWRSLAGAALSEKTRSRRHMPDQMKPKMAGGAVAEAVMLTAPEAIRLRGRESERTKAVRGGNCMSPPIVSTREARDSDVVVAIPCAGLDPARIRNCPDLSVRDGHDGERAAPSPLNGKGRRTRPETWISGLADIRPPGRATSWPWSPCPGGHLDAACHARRR